MSNKQHRALQPSMSGTVLPAAGQSATRGASRRVTTGRNFHPSADAADVAIIDWFACTIRPGEVAEAVGIQRWIGALLSSTFGLGSFTLLAKRGGWNGYAHRLDVLAEDGSFLGLAAHGGESQRGSVYLSLDGKGCARVASWASVRFWGEQQRAKIKRLDLAHDDLTGERINVATALAWFHAGAFTVGGRPPSPRYIDDLGTGKGKTLYLGCRENGKLIRFYEKGRQLGDPASPWVRAEVEMHGTDRVIPWDALTRPGDYFAGAYPCLQSFSATPTRIATTQRAAQIEYDAMQRWVQQAAGGALYVICKVENGDPSAVLAKVMRNKVPKRLRSYPGFERESS